MKRLALAAALATLAGCAMTPEARQDLGLKMWNAGQILQNARPIPTSPLLYAPVGICHTYGSFGTVVTRCY